MLLVYMYHSSDGITHRKPYVYRASCHVKKQKNHTSSSSTRKGPKHSSLTKELYEKNQNRSLYTEFYSVSSAVCSCNNARFVVCSASSFFVQIFSVQGKKSSAHRCAWFGGKSRVKLRLADQIVRQIIPHQIPHALCTYFVGINNQELGTPVLFVAFRLGIETAGFANQFSWLTP